MRVKGATQLQIQPQITSFSCFASERTVLAARTLFHGNLGISLTMIELVRDLKDSDIIKMKSMNMCNKYGESPVWLQLPNSQIVNCFTTSSCFVIY